MKDPKELIESAWNLLEDGDLDGARRVGVTLASDEATAGDGLLLQAACDREEGETESALTHLRAAIALDAEWATPLLWSAEILATEHGRAAEALDLAARALDVADEEEVFVDALALKAGLEISLGSLDAARATLEDAPPPGEADVSPPVLLEIAHLYLAVGDVQTAREHFEALVAADGESADAWHGVGLAADLAGDTATRDRAWTEALTLDKAADDDAGHEAFTDEEVLSAAADVLKGLPARVQTALGAVPLRCVDYPTAQDVAAGVDPRQSVRFVGADDALTEVLFFRKGLERETDDPVALREEIADALLSETEHFFGWSDEGPSGDA